MKTEDRVSKARMSLLIHQPFFGTLLMHMPAIVDESVPTMATDGRFLYYNPAWVAPLSDQRIRGVLVHELAHVFLKHMLRRQRRNPRKFNIACVTGDTLVMMADGTQKPIPRVQVGEWVLGQENGILRPAKVLATLSKVDRVMHIRLHNENQLTCTPTHRILTNFGYVETQKCDRARHFAQVVRPGTRICGNEYQQADHDSDGGFAGVEVFAGEHLLAEDWSVQDSQDRQTSEPQGSFRFDGNRMGLHGWHSGRGGNYFHATCQRQVLPSALGSDQYSSLLGHLVREAGILQHFLNQPSRQPILENLSEWLPDFGASEWHAALSHYQETAGRDFAALHRPSSSSRLPFTANEGNAGFVPADSRIECSGFQVITALEGQRRVFDLTTTTHSYVANGILTHNCDYAINGWLDTYITEMKAIGQPCSFELPSGGCLDHKLSDGRSAEEIYNLLPDSVSSMSGSGAGSSPGEFFDPPSQTAQQADVLEQEISIKIVQAATFAKQRGKFPGCVSKLLTDLLEPKVPWRDVLRQFMRERARDDYSWTRPARRYLHTGFIFPGLYSERMGRIVIVRDTSGSMFTPEMLATITAEAQAVLDECSPASIEIVDCDARVQQSRFFYPGDRVSMELNGGGGTDFRPAFKHVAKSNDEPPVCLVFLTDMYGAFPEEAPPYPVLWAVPGGWKGAYPFGQLVDVC